ncbi:hypothetical protein E8E14_014390 [Neopestalotiopsis sp. 37M]|nr:hypothetical protein E8E14_014390 [Neopestalotiopsis sp. 37M]
MESTKKPVQHFVTDDEDEGWLSTTGHLLVSLRQENEDDTELLGAPSRTLGRVRYGSLCTQVALALFPLLFVALASTAISLNTQPTSLAGERVERAIALSPSIFPIIFAAIVSKFFRTLALFLAERGTTLGTIERLVGSQSLFSTVEKQFVLRGQYLLGCSMILLWILSPVGGQLALRLLSISPSFATYNSTIRYLPIAASLTSSMEGADAIGSGWASYGPIFMTSLITSRGWSNSSQDLYGNTKIPSLDRMGSVHAVDADGWIVLNDSQTIPYSSILGVPVVGIPPAGWLSFDIQSRYMVVDCSTPVLQINSTIFYNDSGTNDGSGAKDWLSGASFTTQQPEWNSSSEAPLKALFNISSTNDIGRASDISFASCSVSPRDVQSSVYCRDQLCRVLAMRKLPVEVSSWKRQYFLVRQSLDVLPLATIGTIRHGSLSSSSLTEQWIQEPDSTYDMFQLTNLSRLPEATLSRNFELMFNTFFQSTFGAEYLFGNLSTNMSLYDNITHVTNPLEQTLDFNTSQVTITKLEGQQYTCNIKFASLLIVISSILFLICIISITIETNTLAPDILGYVSSLTRDNPFVPCGEASYLDGLDRAKVLNDMMVGIGDVKPGSETGHIAVASTAEMTRLQRDRAYH